VSSAAATKLNVPAITQSIVNSGLVLVYLRVTGTTSFYSLPFIRITNAIYQSDVGLGFVNIIANFNSPGYDFKVVVIPGGSVTTLQVTHPGLNFKNYNDVASALNLN
jgi:hypothetical protein